MKELIANAIIELWNCDERDCVIVLDEEQFEKNKKDVLNKYGL